MAAKRGKDQTRGFDADIAARIIEELREGKTLIEVCAVDGMPSDRTVRRWQNDHDDFRADLQDARLDGIWAKLDDAEMQLRNAKSRDDVLRAKEMCNHVRWMAEKLLAQFQPVNKHDIRGNGFVIGWADTIDENDPVQVAEADAVEDEGTLH